MLLQKYYNSWKMKNKENNFPFYVSKYAMKEFDEAVKAQLEKEKERDEEHKDS